MTDENESDSDISCDEDDEPTGVGNVLFNEAEIASWSCKEAVLWISKARSHFEVLGLQPIPISDASNLRARYKRLSLLVHPDKNPDPDAAECFQRLSAALSVLSNEKSQKQLLQEMFPDQYMGPTGDSRATQAGSSQRLRKQRRVSKNAVFTLEQAAAAAHAEQKLKHLEEAANRAVRERIARKRSLQELAPSKKLQRERKPKIAEGLLGEPHNNSEDITFQVPLVRAHYKNITEGTCPANAELCDPNELWQKKWDFRSCFQRLAPCGKPQPSWQVLLSSCGIRTNCFRVWSCVHWTI